MEYAGVPTSENIWVHGGRLFHVSRESPRRSHCFDGCGPQRGVGCTLWNRITKNGEQMAQQCVLEA